MKTQYAALLAALAATASEGLRCQEQEAITFDGVKGVEALKITGDNVDVDFTFGDSTSDEIVISMSYYASATAAKTILSVDSKTAILDLTSIVDPTNIGSPSSSSSLFANSGAASTLAFAAYLGQDRPVLGSVVGSLGLLACANGQTACDHVALVNVALPDGVCPKGFNKPDKTLSFGPCSGVVATSAPTATAPISTPTPPPVQTPTPAPVPTEAPVVSPPTSAKTSIKAVNADPTGPVLLEGVVTYDGRDTSKRSFHIQMTKAAADADTTVASEAILVRCSSNCNAGTVFKEGDLVKVAGTAGFFSGSSNTPFVNSNVATEVTVLCDTPSVQIGGAGSFQACAELNIASITLPVPSLTVYNASRAMLVKFEQDLFITNHYDIPFGTLMLAAEGPVYAETMEVEPGQAALDKEEENKLKVINMDDGYTSRCPSTPVWPATAPNAVRLGYKIPQSAFDGTLVLSYEYINARTQYWAVIPNGQGRTKIASSIDSSTNTRQAALDELANLPGNDISAKRIRIAGNNVLNYYITLGGDNCPGFTAGCRGATNEEDFLQQQIKIIRALAAIDGAVVALQEIQNNGSNGALKNLTEALNQFIGEAKFAYVETPANPDGSADFTGVGNDSITSAIIYQPALVTPVGEPKYYTFTNPSDKTRDAVAQTFALANDNTKTFTVVANHFKSKGSPCDEDGASPPAGATKLYGEGNCGYTRLTHAKQLVEWMATEPSFSADQVLLGDFNSHLKDRSMTELLKTFTSLGHASNPKAYSYTFSGKLSTLDYGLASSSMAAKCTTTVEWHINADEPSITDYEGFCYADAFDGSTPFRASDHDPLVTVCEF